jgi:hypothetical protein
MKNSGRLAAIWTFLLVLPSLSQAETAPGSPLADHKPDRSRPTGPFAQFELHGSVLNDAPERSFLNGAFGYGFKGGYRYRGLGAFAFVEHDLWLASEMEMKVVNGVFNYGLGLDLIHGAGYVRSALALGLSTLVYDTALDKAGTTGLFVDVHPVGLRFAIHDRLVLGFDPLTFTLVAPQLSGIPLVKIEYRTTVYAEALF